MRSIWSVRERYSSKTSVARRRSVATTGRATSDSARNLDSKSDGRTRRNAASNSETQIVGTGEEPDLRAFGLIGWRKPHASASEQDDGGRAVRDLRDERGAGTHLDRDVGTGDDEIANVELTRGVQRQAEEPATFETGSMRSMRQSLGSVLAGGGLTSTRHVASLASMPRSTNTSMSS